MAVDSIYCLLTENGTSGTYWASLPTTDPGGGGNYKDRYYHDGSYRVYSRYVDWKNACSTLEEGALSMVLEIQGSWTDTTNPYASGGYEPKGFYSIEITTKVNGVRDPDSYHFGVPGGGWRLYWSGNNSGVNAVAQSNYTVDGIEIHNYHATLGYGVRITNKNVSCTVKNCILKAGLHGAFLDGAVCKFYNNIMWGVGNGPGIYINSNGSGVDALYNLVYGCLEGIKTNEYGTGRIAYNISINNTTNYINPATPEALLFAAYNCGETGDTPVDTQAVSTAITVSSTDFTDSANSDYTPVSTGDQVDIHRGFIGSFYPDILDIPRPSYNLQTPDLVDAGPFEYDHGNGLAPQTVTISITNIIEGSVLAMYNSSTDAEIIAPTTIGVTGEYTDTSFEYTADVPVAIYVRKSSSGTKYKPWKGLGTITSGGLNVVVSQVEDTVAI